MFSTSPAAADKESTLDPFKFREEQNNPPTLSSQVIFGPGSEITTSQVLNLNSLESKQIETLRNLKPWMVEFQETLPSLSLPVDTLSNAQPDLAVTLHLTWDVKKINFDTKTIDATATYSYRNKILDTETAKGNDKLVLDTKKLDISSVKIDGSPVSFEVVKNPDQKDPNKCDALKITIPSNKGFGSVVIEYTTHPEASGLFWIDPKYTTGKTHPLLYTLFFPNEGASVIPGQHSPQIRLTWEVNVSTGSPDLIALSSVKNNPRLTSTDGKYQKLYMDRKIPLYLLCLEVGKMAFKEYMDEKGKPTGFGVYSEPETLDETANAFADMPQYIKIAEKLFGPYKWGRYDGSVLCNAFPYYAMEHPCKSTFGKICLGAPEVIAHEIAHSWLGNDITNATWFEFFFNEGFTSFAEVLIIAEMHGWDRAALTMMELLGEMEKAIEEYRDARPGLLPLVSTDIEFSRIPYAKGALFFFMLRKAIGENEFGDFIKDYMNVFYQNSMSTDRFLAFLKAWLKHERRVNDFEKFKKENKINEWLYEKEIPHNRPEFKSKLLVEIAEEVKNVLSNKPANQERYKQWTEQMKSNFLSQLEGKIDRQQVIDLDEQLKLTDSTSLIMRNAWSEVCAKAGYYTPKTKEFIIKCILEQNNKLKANLISAALCKTAEGRELAKELLERGKKEDCLFEVTRQVIEENIKKNNT